MRLVGFASLTTTAATGLPATTTVAVATTFTLTLLPSITSASPTILPLPTPAALLLRLAATVAGTTARSRHPWVRRRGLVASGRLHGGHKCFPRHTVGAGFTV